jgi:hypothetical protein
MKLSATIPCVFSQYRPGSSILAVRGYADRNQGVSDFSLAFHVSYENALKKSVAHLQGLELTDPLAQKARDELVLSYVDSLSLAGHNPRATSAHAYERVFDAEGKVIAGVKWHTGNEELHLWGFRIWKRIIVPGVYPEVKSRPLTIEKNKLRAQLPLSRFRQFRLTADNFERLCVEAHVFGPEDCP